MAGREKLVSCYRTNLALTEEHGGETVTFPLISSGIFGYPKDQVPRVAADTISDFLMENDMMVYIVIFDRAAYQISSKLFSDIAEYIDDHYVDEHPDSRRERLYRLKCHEIEESIVCEESASHCVPMTAATVSGGLDDLLNDLNAGLSEALLRLIVRKGLPKSTNREPKHMCPLQNLHRRYKEYTGRAFGRVPLLIFCRFVLTASPASP